jgi:leader peptidase (prepilin peptidase)/N-methyltransferase
MLSAISALPSLAAFIVVLSGAGIIASLVWLALIDLKTRTLPNPLVVAVALLGLVFLCATTVVRSGDLLWSVGEALVVMLLIVGLSIAAQMIVRKRQPEAIGGGDIKLLAALCLTLGSTMIPVLLASCLLALLISLLRRQSNFPFGPYLALFGSIAILLQW